MNTNVFDDILAFLCIFHTVAFTTFLMSGHLISSIDNFEIKTVIFAIKTTIFNIPSLVKKLRLKNKIVIINFQFTFRVGRYVSDMREMIDDDDKGKRHICVFRAHRMHLSKPRPSPHHPVVSHCTWRKNEEIPWQLFHDRSDMSRSNRLNLIIINLQLIECVKNWTIVFWEEFLGK